MSEFVELYNSYLFCFNIQSIHMDDFLKFGYNNSNFNETE